ncbi:MAG: hypothetical protein V4722_12665 [Bacteroidota bacterium]
MRTTKILNIIYYLNNTVFSFLFLFLVINLVNVAIVVLKTLGVVSINVSFSTSIYNVINGIITEGCLLHALYQSFLALNILKTGTGNFQLLPKYFYRSGIFFCLGSLINLLSIGHIRTNADAIGKIYTSENFYVGVKSSSLMLFAIGTLLVFISTLKLVSDNRPSA